MSIISKEKIRLVPVEAALHVTRQSGSTANSMSKQGDDLIGKVKPMAYAAANTSLPAKPNMKEIAEYVMSVNSKALKGR